MSLQEFIHLFTWPLVTLAAVAVCAPLVGAFLFVRGAAFQGIVLPQVAAFGVSLGFALFPFMPHGADDGGAAHAHSADEVPRFLLLVFASVAVLAAMRLLGIRSESGAERTTSDASIGAGLFAVASGGTVLAAQMSPQGGLHVDALLTGETLASGIGDAAAAWVVAGVTAFVILARWRDFTLSGHDYEFAAAAGRAPERSDALLGLVIAAVVLMGSMTVGVLAMFATMTIPPLVARRRARSMAAFLCMAPVFGTVAAILGTGLSFAFDFPINASVAAGAALLWGTSLLLPAR